MTVFIYSEDLPIITHVNSLSHGLADTDTRDVVKGLSLWPEPPVNIE